MGLAFDLPFIRATGCPDPTNLARDPSGLWLAYGGACSQVVPPLPSGYRITPPWNASVTITSLLITNWSPNATLPFIVRFTTPTGATLDVVVPRGSAKGKAWSLPAQGLTIPAASPDTPPLTPGYTVELLAFPGDTPSRTAWVGLRALLGDVARWAAAGSRRRISTPGTPRPSASCCCASQPAAAKALRLPRRIYEAGAARGRPVRQLTRLRLLCPLPFLPAGRHVSGGAPSSRLLALNCAQAALPTSAAFALSLAACTPWPGSWEDRDAHLAWLAAPAPVVSARLPHAALPLLPQPRPAARPRKA